MKRNLLIVVAVLAALTLVNVKAKAQVATGPVPVKIILTDVLAITLNSNAEVLFNYAAVADYQTPKTVSVANQLSVISTKAYSVKVTANALFTVIAGNATPVPLSVVNVAATATNPANAATLAGAVPLSDAINTPVTIASAGVPTLKTDYSLAYSIPDVTPLIGKAPGTYTTNLIYSVTQP
ncbi:hypothetical protein OQY15_18940 [Pedobacter sp. MC2016-15]|uniref:hypothetical protein n=1 Tax=Pedobacter sp. MC2016-15 TaxID=2994473 RepID=UPI00224503F9|nr:hypothetical protein [Pedobacter sp. MC2016-15]MCX2481189.1 hypothetical protein [Pedobacter sp. MC2016-15]